MTSSTFPRLPWWVTTLGLGCAALGTYLVFRPFTSLSILLVLVIAARVSIHARLRDITHQGVVAAITGRRSPW
jgi:hypothetical protein